MQLQNNHSQIQMKNYHKPTAPNVSYSNKQNKR